MPERYSTASPRMGRLQGEFEGVKVLVGTTQRCHARNGFSKMPFAEWRASRPLVKTNSI
jgi:hypothetical protein